MSMHQNLFNNFFIISYIINLIRNINSSVSYVPNPIVNTTQNMNNIHPYINHFNKVNKYDNLLSDLFISPDFISRAF